MLLRRLPTTAAAGAAAGAGASTRTLVTHAAPLARGSWHRAAARCGPAALRLPSLVHEPPRRRPADPWDGQAATFASYTGRGKPTRTRVREQTEAEEETRYNTLAQRHDESVSEQQRQQSVAGERQMDSLGDAGLKTFMANVYMTTGGCIGMAAVGSALPIIGVVPMLNPWIPCIGMIGTYMYLQMRTDERTNPTKRAALLGACTMFAGMSLTPALVVYSAMDPTIAPVAFGLTCLIFGGSTAGALSEHRPPPHTHHHAATKPSLIPERRPRVWRSDAQAIADGARARPGRRGDACVRRLPSLHLLAQPDIHQHLALRRPAVGDRYGGVRHAECHSGL